MHWISHGRGHRAFVGKPSEALPRRLRLFDLSVGFWPFATYCNAALSVAFGAKQTSNGRQDRLV
jgi:hypothetical protein